MPPQKKNLTSETGRDAAGRCREFGAASGKDATGGDVPAGRRDAEIVVPMDACPEKEAAKRPATSTRNFLSLLKRCWRAFQERRQRERLRVSLHDLSNRELVDIGLTSADIDYIDAHRTIERLRDGTWVSRGLM